MTKTKIWLIVAASLSALGIIIFVGVMAVNNWNWGGLSTTKFVTNTHEITEEFSDIFIGVSTADIEILPSDDGKVKVICTEQEKLIHSVTVENGVLEISLVDSRKWYDHISLFSFESSKIIVYLPESEYGRLRIRGSTGDVKAAEGFTFSSIDFLLSTGDSEILSSSTGLVSVEADTGDITIRDITVRELSLTVTTGRIELSKAAVTEEIEINVSTGKALLSDITCRNLISDGDTGDITLKNVVASEKFDIERSTGDVKFESSDAAEIEIKTDTGNVTGSFKTDKIIFADTDTGRVDVPKSVTGGKCEIKTDTGNVKITIE